uniref:Uncharacterized protein n=1 Tax=Parascaris univalens TaxID=6257 RepID=A0A915C2P9_PARUN
FFVVLYTEINSDCFLTFAIFRFHFLRIYGFWRYCNRFILTAH